MTPRSRSKGFPYLEEKWIGGDYRSRSPLLDPSRMSKNHGGIKRYGKFFQGNNGGERVEELSQPKVEEGLFIAQAEM